MPAFVTICQIDNPDIRKGILEAIQKQTGVLHCSYEISILKGGGDKDWDLMIQAPDNRGICLPLYEEKGDLRCEVFERRLRDLLKGECCCTLCPVNA